MSAKKDFNKANRHGVNKLIMAIEQGRTSEVQKMIAEGASVHFKSEKRGAFSSFMRFLPYASGSTPLHVASLFGHQEIVSLLINEGAEINARNAQGHTPLDLALQSHTYYAETLQKQSSSKLLPKHVARKTAAKVDNYEDMIRLLISCGGKTAMFALPDRLKAENAAGEAKPLVLAKNILPPKI